jgi:hypothetical protein
MASLHSQYYIGKHVISGVEGFLIRIALISATWLRRGEREMKLPKRSYALNSWKTYLANICICTENTSWMSPVIGF